VFAEPVTKRWFILSAKYGLLDPDTEIAPYEKTLNGAAVSEKRKWAEEITASLRQKLSPSDIVVITAGENYCRYLTPLIQKFGNKVERPLKGLSMGFQPGRLRQLTAFAKTHARA
jgi:uncharacterized protein DUF6884